MIVVDQLQVCVGKATLIDKISFSAEAGELVCLMGPNGAGKSTTLNVLSGDLAPTKGRVLLTGDPLETWSAKALAKVRAVLRQQHTLGFSMASLDVVLLGRMPHNQGRETDADVAIACQALARVGVEHLRDRDYLTLSGGEQKRVQMARILAQLWDSPGQGPCVLMLDEPTASLDWEHRHSVLALTREITRQGALAIVVLHDFNLAAQYADRLIVLNHGHKVADAPPTDVLTPALLADVFHVRSTILPHPHHPDVPLVVTDRPLSSS